MTTTKVLVSLSEDELHVILDALSIAEDYARTADGVEPWSEYTTEPDEDPKASSEGWLALVETARRAIAGGF